MQLVVGVTYLFLLLPNTYLSFQIPNRAFPFLHSYFIWIIRYLIFLYENKGLFTPFSLYRFVFEYHSSSFYFSSTSSPPPSPPPPPPPPSSSSSSISFTTLCGFWLSQPGHSKPSYSFQLSQSSPSYRSTHHPSILFLVL